MASGPLAGVKVLEFTQIIAGPFCGQHLADMGADVIKFEPLEGEVWRTTLELVPKESRAFAHLNRGKRAVAMDMNRPEAQEAIHRLVPTADVVIINYRPGVAEQLGIDYATLSKLHPRLIYCENTAFGRQGPLAKRGGYDLVVQALTGLMAGEAKMQGDVPAYIYPAIADYATGIQMANSINAALYYRERTGKGQRIDCTLMATAVAMQGAFTWIDAFDTDVIPAMLAELREARAQMQPFAKQVEIHRKYRPLPAANIYYRVYQTADGFMTVGALSDPLRRKVLEITGIEDPRMREDGSFDIVRGPDPRLTELIPKAEAVFRTKTTDEWGVLFEAAGVPCGPLYFVEELFGHPQTLANGLEVELEHALLGSMRLAGPPFQMSESPLEPQGASPVLGSNTDEVLAEVGYAEGEIAALRDAGVIR